MKKLITSVLLFLVMISAGRSATVIVNVEDFQFSPADININVGDTVVWLWNEGMHTTTSTNIPAGATPWNVVIDQSHLMYIYIPAVAGSYDYECANHATMGMLGHMTVTGVTDVSSNYELSFLSLTHSTNELKINFDIPSSGSIALRMYDIIGKPVYNKSVVVKSGRQEQIISTEAMRKGIYIVEIASAGTKISRKIMIQ